MRLIALPSLVAAFAAFAALVVASCTPLLGGDVPCNDNGDCPPARPLCVDDVCAAEGEGEGEGEAGEGEGEGEQALTLTELRAAPFVMFADEAIALTFTLVVPPELDVDDVACTLDFDRIARVPALLSADDITARTVSFTLSDEEIASVAPGEVVIARLQCDDDVDANTPPESTAIAAFEPRTGLRVTTTRSLAGLPLSGGDIEICWSTGPLGPDPVESETIACTVSGPTESADGGSQGCATLNIAVDNPLGDITSAEVFISCCDSDPDALGACGSAVETVAVGSGAARLDVSPPILAEPGNVVVAWQGNDVDDCVLDVLDFDTGAPTEIARGASGTAVVFASRNTYFTTTCDGDEARVRGANVEVGPSARYHAAVPNRGYVVAQWETRMLATCDLSLSSGDRFGGQTQAGANNAFFETNFSSDPAVGSLEASLDCDGFAGPLTRTTVIDDKNPMRIENVRTKPAAAPATGGTIEMCWQSSANVCIVFRNEDDDGAFGGGSDCIDVDVEPFEDTEFRDVALVCETDAILIEMDSVPEFTIRTGEAASLVATPTALTAPGNVTLAWESAEASSCDVVDAAGDVVASGLEGEATVSVDADALFRVECDGPSGDVTAEVLVPVGARIDSFFVRAAPEGDRVLLAWDAPGASRCAVDVGNAGGSVALDNLAPYMARQFLGRTFPLPRQKVSELPVLLDLLSVGDTTVVLTCTDDSGAVVTREAVVPEPSEAVIESLLASPADLPLAGGDVDVCWTSTGAEACFLVVTDNSTGAQQSFDVEGTGCVDDVALTATSRTFLLCFGALGQDTRELIIPVGPAFRSISASPAALEEPGVTVVSWDVGQVSACRVTDDTGVEVASGTGTGAATVSIDVVTTFIVTCDAVEGGTITDDVVVAVGPSIVRLEPAFVDPFIVSLRFQTFRVDVCDVRGTGADGEIVDFANDIFGGCDFQTGQCEVSGYYDFTLHGDLTVTATCDATGGTPGVDVVTKTLTIAAGEPTPTFTSVTIDPLALPTGGGTTEVCWQSVDADLCVFDGVDVPLTGCVTRSYDVTSTFALLCANDVGPRSVDEQILVGPGVARARFDRLQVILDVDPTAALSWDTNELAACEIVELDGSLSSVALDGTHEITFTTPGETYVELRCTDAAGAQYLGYGGVRVF